jgi:hypothetical protein
MMIVSRCLERIGDHAVDIGERVAYLVTGEFREFTDASHPPSPLAGARGAQLASRGVKRTWVLAAVLVVSLATLGGELAPRAPAAPQGIEKIKHVVVIMQENRSFDEYFGTFPGADGIPMRNGRPTVCNPDTRVGQVRPPRTTTRTTATSAGPTACGTQSRASTAAHGRLPAPERATRSSPRAARRTPFAPSCRPKRPPDVMGYQTTARSRTTGGTRRTSCS